jgi:hypothetical protein
MKIHQLPMGARFEYAGQSYVKTGPLIGSGESGQRLIPKYAVLKVLDGCAPEPAAPVTPLTRDAVLAAFAAYHATCAALVVPEHRPALEQARMAFHEAIK